MSEPTGGHIMLSAQVILRPAEPGTPRIVGEDDVERIRRVFEMLGFEVAPEFAGSFAIVGSAELFDSVFPSVTERFGVDSCTELTSQETELPVGDLAEAVGDLLRDLAAIVFTAPPDFGPGNP